MEKIAAGEDLTLLPLDDVLEMLVRETYARFSPSPDWEFPPPHSGFNYKGDTAGLLKHLIQLAWQAWESRRYTLYGMDSYRTDGVRDRLEFLEKVLEYEDVDFATISSAVSAVHQFIKKARYETKDGYSSSVFAWTLTTFVNLDGYDLLDAYNVMMQEAKNNWLETFDTWVGSKYHIYSGISRVDYTVSGHTAFNKYEGRFTVSIPYRVECPGNFKDWFACFHPQKVKRYIYKNSVEYQRDDSLGDCIECGIGSLAERTQGVIPLNEEWEEEGNPGVKKFYGSEVLLPEYEDGLGGNITPVVYKRDRANYIIANGGTVPGYAG